MINRDEFDRKLFIILALLLIVVIVVVVSPVPVHPIDVVMSK